MLGISCSLRMRGKATASPRLLTFVRYEAIPAHYLPQILTIRGINFVVIEVTDMLSVICPEVISISVTKTSTAPSPEPLHRRLNNLSFCTSRLQRITRQIHLSVDIGTSQPIPIATRRNQMPQDSMNTPPRNANSIATSPNHFPKL